MQGCSWRIRSWYAKREGSRAGAGFHCTRSALHGGGEYHLPVYGAATRVRIEGNSAAAAKSMLNSVLNGPYAPVDRIRKSSERDDTGPARSSGGRRDQLGDCCDRSQLKSST